MRNFLIILLLILFSNSLFGQVNYTFISAGWGQFNQNSCDSLKSEINASELFWGDSLLTVCIIQENQYISKNFHIVEQSDNSGVYTLDFLLQTSERYTIHISGGYIQSKPVITLVHFYYEGEKIGYLSCPIY